jgi:hypothetical protein
VHPEGFWAQYKLPGLDPVQPFVGAGLFSLREIGQSTLTSPAHDTTLWAYQAGTEWKIVPDVKYTFAAVYMDYDHYDLSALPTRGNDTLRQIPNFHVIDLVNRLEFKMLNIPTTLCFDWAHNFDDTDGAHEYENEDDAYFTGIKLGQNKKQGDWSFRYLYASVQANSLPGYFVDGDFGYANRQGHIWGVEYNLLDDVSVAGNVFWSQPLHSATTTNNARVTEDSTTTFRLDFNWKF